MILYIFFSFIWNRKCSSLPHPTRKDPAGQPLKLLAYDACRQKPELDSSGNKVICTAKRWRFDLFDSNLTLIHYVGHHNHPPNPRQRNRNRLHVDGYHEACAKLQEGKSIRSVATALSNKYDATFTTEVIRSIKRSMYTLNRLSDDNVTNITTLFQTERKFLKNISLASSGKSEIFIVCILEDAVNALVKYGDKQVFVDGLATLSSYGCQIVTLHVKVHNHFFTLGYAIVSG
jgi:hypothetical protein